MISIVRVLSPFIVAVSLLAAIGCGSGSGGGSSGSNTSGGDTTGGSGGGSSGGPSCSGTTCSQGSDCPNLVCSCMDGTDVNTMSCNNGCCDDESAACPGACSSDGGWAG